MNVSSILRTDPNTIVQLATNTYEVHRSRNCLHYLDHMYTIEKTRQLRSYYRCAVSRQLGCKARLVVLTTPAGLKEYTQFKQHTHEAHCKGHSR